MFKNICIIIYAAYLTLLAVAVDKKKIWFWQHGANLIGLKSNRS